MTLDLNKQKLFLLSIDRYLLLKTMQTGKLDSTGGVHPILRSNFQFSSEKAVKESASFCPPLLKQKQNRKISYFGHLYLLSSPL